VWAFVLGGHVLLIALFQSVRSRDVQQPDAESRSVLTLLDLTTLEEEKPPEETPKPLSNITVPPAPSSAITSNESITSDESVAAPAEVSKAPVDWYSEAEHVAKDKAAELLAKQPRPCEDSPRPGSLREKCKRGGAQAQWEPEPKKFGVEGGLPYVRLGKRCLVGLGFFGCAIGKLPEADGTLLEGMKDQDWDHSSVPDTPK
jgi:hypothetical protein